jgi:hypothetical protein
MPGLADTFARVRPIDGHAFGLVDVAAEEVLRLIFLDELAHRARAGVQAGADLVERRAIRRRVADQHQRVRLGEARRRSAICGSLYSPGVLKGVGLE